MKLTSFSPMFSARIKTTEAWFRVPKGFRSSRAGQGFLGSHLTDRLLVEGHRVSAIDNLITGNLKNIEHLAGNENYRFIKHNVSSYIFLREEKLDYVFHFASPASPIDIWSCRA